MPPGAPENESEQEKIERLRRAMYSRSLSGKLKDRARRALGVERETLPEDFTEPAKEEEAPRMVVAPRYIGIARAALWWLLGIAMLFFIGAVGFFAFYFTLGGGSTNASSANIGISVAGPPQIQSGEKTELQIIVENHNTTALELADLVVTYPSGTRSPSDYSTDLPNQRISLGSIEAGGRRQGTVLAVFSGAAGASREVKVELEYHLPGSNAVFVASKSYTLVFASSPLSLSVEGNSQTVSGQPLQFQVAVSSNSSAPVSGVLMRADLPFGFKLATDANPDPSVASKPVVSASGDSALWELGTLDPGQKKIITVQGTLAGEQGDSRVFHFTAGTRSSDASSSDITLPLSDKSFTVSVTKPFLSLALAVNGSTDKSIILSPGTTVTVQLNWENNLTTPIENAAIVARLSGISIDGSTVKSTNGFYRSTDGVMLWDKTTDPSFQHIEPGAHGIAAFSFQLPDSTSLQGIANPALDISVSAAGNRIGETGVPESLHSTASAKIALASDLQLEARGLYYSNPFGSTGPMPPKAGTETTYAIVFTVTNTTNAIQNASVTAQLPAYVRWIGIYSPSSEDVSFNQLAGTVTWKLGSIDPGVGLSGTPPRQAAIAIGFTPSTSQIGTQPALLQHITLTGIDAATGASITRSADDITTNIAGDPGFSSANATVVK